MIYMCIMDYPDDKELLARVRPAHRKYLRGLLAAGKVLAAGSFLPNDDGGLFLYEALSFQEAEQYVHDDPYLKEGFVSAYKLSEYAIHGVRPELIYATPG